MVIDAPRERAKALILYICSKVPCEKSGAIKLNKIMWFSETETMYRTGEPLTGLKYIRQRFGPVALGAPSMRDELIREGKLIQHPPAPRSGKYPRHAFETVGLAPDLTAYFSATQIEIIDEQIEKYKRTGARDLSDISHDSIWAMLDDADEMPLNLYAIKPVYTSVQKNRIESVAEKKEKRYARI